MKKDVGEQNDLIDKEPKIAATLLKKMIEWKQKTGAQEPRANPDYDIKRANQTKPSQRIVKDPLASKDD